MPMTPKDIRDFALSLPETTEQPHFDKSSIRVRGKIFITLSDSDFFVIKLTLDDQAVLTDMFGEIFSPVKSWGKHGWTEVRYPGLSKDQMEDAVIRAFKAVAPKKLVRAL